MKQSNINIKAIIAIFVVAFGMCAIVFVKVEDMALGALISFISAVIGYYFGSSSGSSDKDKTINDLKNKNNVQSFSDEPIIGDRPNDR